MNGRGKLMTAKIPLGTIVALSLAFCIVQPAGASQGPWWHLTIGAAPAVLRQGQAKNEVQEVTVSATGGKYNLSGSYPISASHEFAWNASDSELQAGLEEMFGAGNVEVL